MYFEVHKTGSESGIYYTILYEENLFVKFFMEFIIRWQHTMSLRDHLAKILTTELFAT